MNIPPPDANFAAALAWLVGTAAALTALAVIGRFLVRSVRRMWRWTVTAGRYVEMMHTIVERELTPNGGTSMRDKLNDQCDAMRELLALLQHHIETDDAIQHVLLTDLGALREKSDDTWRRVAGLPARGVE